LSGCFYCKWPQAWALISTARTTYNRTGISQRNKIKKRKGNCWCGRLMRWIGCMLREFT
jgi:hypothetical protein